jgi:hypothetical protein
LLPALVPGLIDDARQLSCRSQKIAHPGGRFVARFHCGTHFKNDLAIMRIRLKRATLGILRPLQALLDERWNNVMCLRSEWWDHATVVYL